MDLSSKDRHIIDDCTGNYLVLGRVTDFPISRTYHAQGTGDYSTIQNQHKGQDKLLMSEIHFLTEVYKRHTFDTPFLCIYAGACPCTHLKTLTVKFPNVFFLLIDPRFREFQARQLAIENYGRVMVCPEYFNDHTANAIQDFVWNNNSPGKYHWVKEALQRCRNIVRKSATGCDVSFFDSKTILFENLLFVSDIRIDARNELSIAKEMTSQGQWFRIVDATAGLLKFRLPYIKKTDNSGEGTKAPVMSLQGDVCLPIFGPKSTTECRLLVRRNCKDIMYDPEIHEEIMAGFNASERKLCYAYKNKYYKTFDDFAHEVVHDNYRKMIQNQRRDGNLYNTPRNFLEHGL